MKSINIRFPLSDDTTTGFLFKTNKISKDAFSSNLLLLLLTEKGERYYRPDFGTNLMRNIFEPSDDITENMIVDDLNKTISPYIPNMKIKNVDFNWVSSEGSSVGSKNTNQLHLKIHFVYNELGFEDEGELELLF